MEENVLKDFETFNEIPLKSLKVTHNSNYFFIRKLKEDFVVKSNIDSVTFVENKIQIEQSYYDINSGDLVLKTKSIKDIQSDEEYYLEKEDKVDIISLSSIFNLGENGVYYLVKEDLDSLIGFKEGSAKTFGLKPRKYYF